MMPKVAVIIVSWNVHEYTSACVRALVTDPVEKEIVVIDNASSDDTVDMLHKEFPEINVIANDQNLGFATAVNQGAAVTTAPIIFVLNPDTRVEVGMLERLVDQFKKESSQSIVGVHLVNEKGETVPSIRTNPTPTSQALVLLKIHRLLPTLLSQYFRRDFDYSREQAVDQVMGSAMAIRRDVFDSLGGFDEQFFIWFEEVDFCKRARDAGYTIQYSPEIRVIDFAGKSFVQVDAKTKARYFTDSLNYYASKHWPILGRVTIRVAGYAHRVIARVVGRMKLKPQARPR